MAVSTTNLGETPRRPLPQARRRPYDARPLLIFTDLGAVLVGVLAGEPSTAWSWALAGLVIVVLGAGGRYGFRLVLNASDDIGRVLGHVGAALALASVGSAAMGWPIGEVVRQLLATGVLLLVARTVAYAGIRAHRRRGGLVPTVIVGSGEVCLELARLLQAHPEHGLICIGVVDDVVDDLTAISPVPRLGGTGDLPQVIEDHDVGHVIVAFSATREHALIQVIRSIVLTDVGIHIVPRFFEIGLGPTDSSTELIRGIPLYRVRRAALRASSFRLKRVFDAALSGLALVAAAPLLGAIALAVRLSSEGPILFRQRRVGQHGREFEVLKFRTMAVNDDADVTWSVDDDHRLTRIGRILRATSLDELPQFWNVLVGDMSLVGPRPERPHFVDRFGTAITGYDDRHRLPAGLTGLAQINGLRGDTSIKERARFDNFYVEHWSPVLDLWIMAKTPASVVRQAMESRRAKAVGSDGAPLRLVPRRSNGRVEAESTDAVAPRR